MLAFHRRDIELLAAETGMEETLPVQPAFIGPHPTVLGHVPHLELNLNNFGMERERNK